MNYLASNFLGSNRRRGGRRFLRSPAAIVIIGLMFWWLISRPAVYRFGETAMLALARPFWSAGGRVIESASRVSRFFASRRALVAENNNLRIAAAKLETFALERDRLALDNQSLREILNRNVASTAAAVTVRTVTAARVLTRPNQSPFGMIILDVGAETVRQSVAIGDLVLGAGGAALGEVAAVHPRAVKIKLFSAWGERLEVLVGSERIPAEARGRGGGNFAVSLPRDLAASADDPVMMIWDGDEYTLGRISAVLSDPAAAFQEILFRSPVNLDLLSWVKIYGS